MNQFKANEKLIALASQVLDIEATAIQAARATIGSAFIAATKLVLSHSEGGRVVVMGMGKSGHIGCKIAATLASTGTPSVFVHPAEAGHGDLGMITKVDTVLAISQSGESEEILKLIPYLKLKKIPIIAMCGVSTSQLARFSDVLISTVVDREACPLGLAPTTSTTLTLALGDALAIVLLESRGFKSDDFALTHPLGALGRRLLIRVADVMTPLIDVPVVHAEDNIGMVILEITRRATGFAVIADTDGYPKGIFTDGDLRRALGTGVDIKSTPVSTVMTRNFTSISHENLAAEALSLMEEHQVSALPTIDYDGKLLGTVTLKQIIAAGIA